MELPAFTECCYLNTGASGPSPRRVVAASAEYQRRSQFHAPCGQGVYESAREALEDARAAVARLLDTEPERIALSRSTVEGINHVATAIDWQPGDVVVRTDLEHPAGALPWARMRDLYDIEIRELPTERGRVDLDTVADVVSDARLLCLSSLSWNYGTRLPVGEIVDIAHDSGTLVLVDAVQSIGQVPVSIEEWGVDFVVGSGHKWLLGPWGTGFLYIDEVEALEPDRIGYFSVETEGKYRIPTDNYRFRSDARRFELGTTAVAPYVGLQTAIETMEAIGIDTIEARIARLRSRLKDGLGDRLVSPQDAASGLVTFSADDPQGLVETLANAGIRIRWLPEPYACRVSVHAYNTEADIDRLLEGV